MVRRHNFKRTILVSLFVFSSVYADTDNGSGLLPMLIAKIDRMNSRLVTLERSEVSLKLSVGELIATTAQFKQQIADLSEKLEAYEISDREKDVRIKALEDEIAKNSEKNRVVDREEPDYEQGAEDEAPDKGLEENPTKRGIRQTPEQVAFSAYLDHVIRRLGPDQPIVYNMVLLNEAGAYSRTTGIYN